MSTRAPYSAQQALALAAHALRQRQHQVIALGRAHERERDPRVAAGGLHDRRAARLDPAFGLGGLDHRHADAVLDAPARVERLELGEQLDAVVGRRGALEHARKPDQRGASDQLVNVDRDWGHKRHDNSGRRAPARPGSGVVSARLTVERATLRFVRALEGWRRRDEDVQGPPGRGRGSVCGRRSAGGVGERVAILPYLKFVASGVDGKPTIQVSGANVQILSGAGKEETLNGEGNLIIGYDELPGTQTGSNNLMLGAEQAFTSYGSILGGEGNSSSGSGSILGGAGNTASSYADAVFGLDNKAVGGGASVSGGLHDEARAQASSVSGGLERRGFMRS